MNRTLVRTTLVGIIALVASCGDGSNPPTVAPDIELEAPEPRAAGLAERPYVFHSLFSYVSVADLAEFTNQIVALDATELPERIAWRTQEVVFPGVDVAAQVDAMSKIDAHYASLGLALPRYSYTPYEPVGSSWTVAEFVQRFQSLAEPAAAKNVTMDEILVERKIGGTSVAFVKALSAQLPAVSIAVSTTHEGLESGCSPTAAAWDRFYLQFYSVQGTDVCIGSGCTSDYCGASGPVDVAGQLAGLAGKPCDTDPTKFIFMSSYEEATDTNCSTQCLSCFPPLMGAPGAVFTLDRYASFLDAFTAGVQENSGFVPRTGVYVPRNAMAAWGASSAAAYTPYKPDGKSCACS